MTYPGVTISTESFAIFRPRLETQPVLPVRHRVQHHHPAVLLARRHARAPPTPASHPNRNPRSTSFSLRGRSRTSPTSARSNTVPVRSNRTATTTLPQRSGCCWNLCPRGTLGTAWSTQNWPPSFGDEERVLRGPHAAGEAPERAVLLRHREQALSWALLREGDGVEPVGAHRGRLVEGAAQAGAVASPSSNSHPFTPRTAEDAAHAGELSAAASFWALSITSSIPPAM